MLTNKLNLPEPIYNAIAHKKYSGDDSDYSVTGLLDPPQMRYLKRKHSGEITEDISDRIFALFGNAIHEILEKSNTNGITETRYKTGKFNKTLSGQIDRYHDGIIQDWKIASVWEYIMGIKEEKIAQLNMYAQLLRDNNIEVSGLQLIFIFRDWSKRESKYNPDYPKNQVWIKDVDLWSEDKTVEYIQNRINLHENFNPESDTCSDSDRWAKPEKWAVTKIGNKKATKLHDFKEHAESHLIEVGKQYEIQYRKGESVRCENYCSVKDFCKQYKEVENGTMDNG